MQKPGFVTLNNHRIKVQRWQDEPGVIAFTTVVRGEHLGQDIVDEVERGEISLVVEDQILTGLARVTDHRASGEGTNAVHRIQIRMETKPDGVTEVESAPDDKLDLILAELRLLRREVAALRGAQMASSETLSPPITGTMLDFEIPSDTDE